MTQPAKREVPQPPCKAACPVHTDARRYIERIAAGDYHGAFDVIRAVNPFPSACSTVCAHPCEEACRRNGLDEPLGIRNLKRFACEQSAEWRIQQRKAVEKTREKSVGIIGGGPAGMTAAHDLAKEGYAVTIYERSPVLGGALAVGIPKYRLPAALLQQDIDDILALGIEAKTNTAVGKDITLNDVRGAHDATLISVGLSQSRSVPLPGIDAKGVLLALPFLYDSALGNAPAIGKSVIVIGGGNVAIDVARTAVRLGAERVTMVCLESRDEMPAWDWEIEEAHEEGISIVCSQGPKQILESNGAVTGLEVKLCECVFDDAGRFNPKFCEDTVMTIKGDTVIVSIGQGADVSFVKEAFPALVNERGNLITDRDSLMTAEAGIFGCGEVASGPGIAIDAIANGHRAAIAIDAYLQGKPRALVELEAEGPTIDALPESMNTLVPQRARQIMPVVDAQKRVHTFDQFELGLNEEAALTEARRCMNCGAGAVCLTDKCAACFTCVRVCPFDVPVVTQTADMAADKCQGCGICASECPAGAILMRGYDINKPAKILGGLLKKQSKPAAVLFTCTQLTSSYGTNEVPATVIQTQVACAGRVRTLDILKAIEHGARSVGIVRCDDATGCRYKEGDQRIAQRVEYVQRMLAELGVDVPVEIFTAHAPAEKAWPDIAAALAEKVN